MLFNRLIFTTIVIHGGHQFIKLSCCRLLKSWGHMGVGIKGYLNTGMS
jgi:hypothetical protein